MKSYSSIIAFFVVLCFAAPVFAQSTSTVHRKKTIATPKKPQRSQPSKLNKTQRPSTKKANNNLNNRQIQQCLNDIEYATGWTRRLGTSTSRAEKKGLSCLQYMTHPTQGSQRMQFDKLSYSGVRGGVKITCKSGGKCLSSKYNTSTKTITIPVKRTRPGMQNILGCFKLLAKNCVK